MGKFLPKDYKGKFPIFFLYLYKCFSQKLPRSFVGPFSQLTSLLPKFNAFGHQDLICFNCPFQELIILRIGSYTKKMNVWKENVMKCLMVTTNSKHYKKRNKVRIGVAYNLQNRSNQSLLLEPLWESSLKKQRIMTRMHIYPYFTFLYSYQEIFISETNSFLILS